MICDYEIQGDGRGSLSIFGDILKAELKPNEEIFTSILSGSSHTGTAGWGRMAGFSTICQDYSLVPTTKHCKCLVDLLARAGRLEEALGVIQKMPVQPDALYFVRCIPPWGLHSRFDLGDVAIKRMLELQTGEACYCVLTCMLQMEDGIRLSRYGS